MLRDKRQLELIQVSSGLAERWNWGCVDTMLSLIVLESDWDYLQSQDWSWGPGDICRIRRRQEVGVYYI